MSHNQITFSMSGEVNRYILNVSPNPHIHEADEKGRTALHYAVKSGDTYATQICVNQGANCDRQDEKGLTPLHIAARECKVLILEILLAFHADKKIRDCRGRMPYDIALKHGQRYLAFMLNPQWQP
jgi:ankyrin repeat protein